MNTDTITKPLNLPFYEKDEEIAHVITHGIGVVLGIAMFIIVALFHQSETEFISGLLFSLSLVLLYSTSSTYHALSYKGAQFEFKKKMQIADHSSIPVLIIGTIIPFAANVIEHDGSEGASIGWIVLGVAFLIGLAIITLNIIDLNRYKVFTMIGYFVIGGSMLVASEHLFLRLTNDGFILFIAGGAAYALGTLFYGIGGKNNLFHKLGIKNRKWMHTVFHAFCVLGSIIHCVCIILYVFGWFR